MVVLILAGMLIIGVPFAVSMRMSGSRARMALADAHARYGAEGAFNHAIACLARTQESYEIAYGLWPKRSTSQTGGASYFESYTLDIPAELECPIEVSQASDTEPSHASDADVDLTREVDARNPKGAIWSVDVEDEQGKVNLNSAPRPLLENLLRLMFDVKQLTPKEIADDQAAAADAATKEAAAKGAAQALVDYRKANVGFHTISEAESVLTDYLKASQPALSARLNARLASVSRYATVSSERPSTQAPHPINVNSAPRLVLTAALMSLRLHTPLATFVRAPDSQGNGYIGKIVRVSDKPEFDGDWIFTFTDATKAKISFIGVEGRTLTQTASTGIVLDQEFPIPAPDNDFTVNNGSEDVLKFSLCMGTLPFKKDDAFYFTTRRVTRKLAERLSDAIQAEVLIKAGSYSSPKQFFQFVSQDDKTLLGEEGKLCIGKDVMSYQFSVDEGPILTGLDADTHFESGKTYRMRSIISQLEDLEGLREVIKDYLGKDIVATSGGTPTDAEIGAAAANIISAIKLNAFRPQATEVEGPTAPFCLATSDTYTIAGRATMNDTAGNHTATRGVKRITSIKRGIPIAADGKTFTTGVLAVDTESAFDQVLAGKGQQYAAARTSLDLDVDATPWGQTDIGAFPANCKSYTEKYPKSVTTATTMQSRRLQDAAGSPSMVLHFDGNLAASSNALSRLIDPICLISPLAQLPYAAGGGVDMQPTNASASSSEGLTFSPWGWPPQKPIDEGTLKNYLPLLAYATRQAPMPGLGTTVKSLEMWVKWPRQVLVGKTYTDWTFGDGDYFLFDTSRPYAVPGQTFGDLGDLRRLCHQNRIALFYSGGESPVSGKKNELVFRISDATVNGQSAEVRYQIDPLDLYDKWHHIQAVWAGMGYGEMALLVDGKAAIDDQHRAHYYPKAAWQMASTTYTFQGYEQDGAAAVIVGNQIYEKPDPDPNNPNNGNPTRRIDSATPAPSPKPGDPVTMYGYDTAFVNNHLGSDPEDAGIDFNDLASYTGTTLKGAVGVGATTTIGLPADMPSVDPTATDIPVSAADLANFQEKGFLYIDPPGEIVFYEGKTANSFTCTYNGEPARGIGIGSAGWGPGMQGGNNGVSTTASSLPNGATVRSISLYVEDNTHFPTPQFFASSFGSTASFFGLSRNVNYVRIGDEFVSYTHKPNIAGGTPGEGFLVDLGNLAGTGNSGSLRGALGTVVAEHDGATVSPVFQVDYWSYGGPGKNDTVTLIDQASQPFEMKINAVGVTARNYVSFDPPTPPKHFRFGTSSDGKRWPRMMKFPCGWQSAGSYFSIGSNSGPKGNAPLSTPTGLETDPFAMNKPAFATIDEFKFSLGDGSIQVPQIIAEYPEDSVSQQNARMPESGRCTVRIAYPWFWQPNYGLAPDSGSPVDSWPTRGYAQIGEEIAYYRTRLPHHVVEDESGIGPVTRLAGGTCFLKTAVSSTSMDAVWNPAGAGDSSLADQNDASPFDAGFNPDGGYMKIVSTKSSFSPPDGLTPDSATMQYMIQYWRGIGMSDEDIAKKLASLGGQWTTTLPDGTQQTNDDFTKAPDDATWNFTPKGSGSYTTTYEVVTYQKLEQTDQGWRFSGLRRGLFGTGTAPGVGSDHGRAEKYDENGNVTGYIYPYVVPCIGELDILQRGCLGTTPAVHPVGAKVLPLYHIISTLIAARPNKPDDPALALDDDRLYVESNANFPQRGYLQVYDSTNKVQEIIGYTGKGAERERITDDTFRSKPYFEGVRWLRRRFCTPLVDLNFPVGEADGNPTADFLAKGVVRLYEPRYDDRLPVDPARNESGSNMPAFQFNTTTVTGAAANLEGNPAYLEITRSIRGARWDSVRWVEGPEITAELSPANRAPSWDMATSDIEKLRDSGTQIFVLARVTDRADGKPAPKWTEQPVAWDSDQAKNGEPCIIRFDDPGSSTETARANTLGMQGDTSGVEGDTIELRIYFRYNEKFASQTTGEIVQWASPVLRGLRIGYSAPSSIYQQEEVRF